MDLPQPADFKLFFADKLWEFVAQSILSRHRISCGELRRSEQGENIVFLADDSTVLKIYTPHKNGFERELRALEFLTGKTAIPVPMVVAAGQIDEYYYLVTTQITGRPLPRTEWLNANERTRMRLVDQLAAGLRQMHELSADRYPFDWPEFLRVQKETAISKQLDEGGNPEWIESLPAYLDEHLPSISEQTPQVFLHGDVHFGNIRVTGGDEELRISGIFDLADSLKGSREYEFIAVGVLMLQGQRDLQRAFFRAYGYAEHEIDESLRKRMMAMTLLYEHSSLRRYAERLRPEAATYTLDELERAIWNFV